MSGDRDGTEQLHPLQQLQRSLQRFVDGLPRPQLSWTRPSTPAASPQAQSLDKSQNPAQQKSRGAVHDIGSIAHHLQASSQQHSTASIQAAPGSAESTAGLPVSREELGRATWTFLHTLAAQYPERPTRGQQKDIKALVDVFTRLYPCRECAEHFRDIVRNKPPRAHSSEELQHWMCDVHNAVNRTLNKPTFNCKFVSQRWGALDCDDQMACSLSVGHSRH